MNVSYSKDCLDLDDLVKAELPNEYNAEKHENVMLYLGEKLNESRKKRLTNVNINSNSNINNFSNDDFALLLCLLRKKKETVYEKSPYHMGYSIKLQDVYINEKFEASGKENDIQPVEDFVNKFIDNMS